MSQAGARKLTLFNLSNVERGNTNSAALVPELAPRYIERCCASVALTLDWVEA